MKKPGAAAYRVYQNFILKSLYPSRYRTAAKAPVRAGSVVFLEMREKALSDNFRLIRAALEHRNARENASYSISVICIRKKMENQAAVVRSCLNAIEQLAQAQFIFVNDSSDFLSSLPIRSETTVIQTWHGCGAFKRFGYSIAGKGAGKPALVPDTFPERHDYSYVTVSSPEVIWAYAEAFHMEDRIERILPVGVSRTDMFFSRKYREKASGKVAWVLRRMAPALFLGGTGSSKTDTLDSGPVRTREVYARLGDVYTDQAGETAFSAKQEVVPDRKIILYAPTFRGTESHASSPDRLDIPMMKRELGDRYILLINHHPFVKEKNRPKIPEDCRDFAFDMTDRLSIEELLTTADVCITDYSSIIFEYSLFEKPMLFYAFDMQDYLDERGFYYPIREMMPGPVCSTTQELTEVLKTQDADFDLVRVRDFKYRFMSGCDGHATARVLQLMDHAAGTG